MAMENVVAENHRDIVIADKIRADNKCLRQSVRARLNRIGQLNAELMAVSKQRLEPRRVARCGNDQNITDSCLHQNRNRIVNHRLVINRKQLLRRYLGQRIQSGSAAAC